LQGRLVDMQAAHAAMLAMDALSALDPGKIAQPAVWDAVVAQGVVLCPTLAPARENTFRRPHIDMSDVVGSFRGRGGISLALSAF